MHARRLTRRAALRALGGGLAAAGLPRWRALATERPVPITRPVPASGEALPVIGLGTWRTFNVGRDPVLRAARTEVLAAFFADGGRVVDSSPMYGSAQDVIGYGLERLGRPEGLFAADKVWTRDGDATRAQVAESARRWRIARFDLVQVHNLLAWEAHLETLQAMKAAGEVRYVGITTSHGRRHRDLEHVMARRDVDFVQLTYNVVDRAAEARLLPLAAERGIAVIANRPFRGGSLVGRLQRSHPLPGWADAIDCRNWPQVLLKFIVSHPAVTCAIPATTRVEHVRENMGAARGALPEPALRERIRRHVESL